MAGNGPKPPIAKSPVKSRPANIPPMLAANPPVADVAVPEAVPAAIAPPVTAAAPALAVPAASPPARVVPAPVETVAAAPLPELSETNAPLNKEPIMDATINTAAEKTQSMFVEANDRAKTAMEKTTRAFEDMNEFSKGNVEALVESSKIAAKGLETLGQEAAEYSRRQFEGATAAMKTLASIKSPTEFFKMQSDFMRQSFDAIVAETSKNTEAMLKLAGEVAQPISNRVALAAEKVKIAA